jgi:hypothetical protein
MKKWIAIILIGALSSSCVNESEKQSGRAKQEKVPSTQPKKEKFLILPWTAIPDPETEEMELKHNAASDVSQFTVQDMIDAINFKYPKVLLKQDGIKSDTLKVSINDASFLTQQMGTAGAESYLAEATFALTELKGIKAVTFSFREGDHAVPKTYSRKDFQDFN